MSIFLLIRHASHDYLGRSIAGWVPGVGLNDRGREEAERLAGRLASARIGQLYSSPLERATETAAAIARKLGLPIQVSEALGEVHYGAWNGRSFSELDADPLWSRYNALRSRTRIPEGELFLEMQLRIVVELERLRERHPEATVAAVSHGDVIKAAIAYYAGIAPDLFHRLEISPASVSTLDLGEHGPRILRLNETPG